MRIRYGSLEAANDAQPTALRNFVEHVSDSEVVELLVVFSMPYSRTFCAVEVPSGT